MNEFTEQCTAAAADRLNRIIDASNNDATAIVSFIDAEIALLEHEISHYQTYEALYHPNTWQSRVIEIEHLRQARAEYA